jgi:hypothetical protein
MTRIDQQAFIHLIKLLDTPSNPHFDVYSTLSYVPYITTTAVLEYLGESASVRRCKKLKLYGENYTQFDIYNTMLKLAEAQCLESIDLSECKKYLDMD